MKRIYSAFLVLLFSFQVYATIPPNYYNSASGLTGAPLKTALYNIISNHTALSYTYLWTAFQTTDKKTNGKVWDMYSDIPGGTPPYEFTFVTDQCGTYNSEGDCFNREHSWPSSWFNGSAPMETDLFHLIPADGYVNNRRGNDIIADVGTASWTSLNGSKVGSCSAPGFTGTAFEPIDAYKGDFARSYMYMVTRYQNLVVSWSALSQPVANILNGTTHPAFESWFITMLGQWSVADPVSQKEIDRNDAVYALQGNRNPFIDHPEYIYAIWGVGAIQPTPTISGPAQVCVNATGNIYTTESGMTNYLWTVSAGGTITSGGSNTITVAWITSGAKTVTVNYTNSGGYSATSPTIYNVTVNPLPVPTISGPASVIVNSSGNIYSTEVGMTGYAWSLSAGGIITSGGTTNSNSATITWNTIGPQSLAVNYTNSNGCAAATALVYNVTVDAIPEPTNSPANFSAHNILLNWTDAIGVNIPSAYLIRMSPNGFNAIADPLNGIPVPDSPTDKNVPSSVQQAWFSNLNPNTTYYFKIFGYSGSGSTIRYKTDGNVPQVQLNTSP
jgi:endonuclease I